MRFQVVAIEPSKLVVASSRGRNATPWGLVRHSGVGVGVVADDGLTIDLHSPLHRHALGGQVSHVLDRAGDLDGHPAGDGLPVE